MIFKYNGEVPACFDHLTAGHLFFVSVSEHDSKVFAYFAVELDHEGGRVLIHMHPTGSMTPERFRTFSADLDMFSRTCRERGFNQVVAVNMADPNDEKWARFVSMLGFPAPVVMALSVKELGKKPASSLTAEEKETLLGELRDPSETILD